MKRVLQAGLLVVLAGVISGDEGALVAVLALGLLVLARAAWGLVPPPRRRLLPTEQVPSRNRFPGYDRVYSACLLSAASARHVDLGLRPVLRRVLAAELEDLGEARVRARVGDRLWSLVDPHRPPAADSSQGGLTARDLRDVLDRLERP